MAFCNQRFHIPVEERQQQGGDMGAVHIGIGHDNDFSVPRFADIEIFPDSAAESCNHIFDFITGQHTVQTGFFYV